MSETHVGFIQVKGRVVCMLMLASSLVVWV